MYSRSSSISVKAKTLDEALGKAAKVLGVKEKLVDFEELEKGFFSSMFGSKVEIKAWIKEKEKNKKSSMKNNKSASGKKGRGKGKNSSGPRKSRHNKNHNSDGAFHKKRERVRISAEPLENESEVIQELQTYCLEICKFIDPEVSSVETSREEDRCVFNINSESIGHSMKKNAKLAESFEHLLRKKPRHLKQDLSLIHI